MLVTLKAIMAIATIVAAVAGFVKIACLIGIVLVGLHVIV